MEAPSGPFNDTALSKHGRLRGSIGKNKAYAAKRIATKFRFDPCQILQIVYTFSSNIVNICKSWTTMVLLDVLEPNR
jgi:hypothetical protein